MGAWRFEYKTSTQTKALIVIPRFLWSLLFNLTNFDEINKFMLSCTLTISVQTFIDLIPYHDDADGQKQQTNMFNVLKVKEFIYFCI